LPAPWRGNRELGRGGGSGGGGGGGGGASDVRVSEATRRVCGERLSRGEGGGAVGEIAGAVGRSDCCVCLAGCLLLYMRRRAVVSLAGRDQKKKKSRQDFSRRSSRSDALCIGVWAWGSSCWQDLLSLKSRGCRVWWLIVCEGGLPPCACVRVRELLSDTCCRAKRSVSLSVCLWGRSESLGGGRLDSADCGWRAAVLSVSFGRMAILLCAPKEGGGRGLAGLDINFYVSPQMRRGDGGSWWAAGKDEKGRRVWGRGQGTF
jgi:hypothetical protein